MLREIDPFDADYDRTEVSFSIVDQNHESFRPAVIPTVPVINVEQARCKLAQAKALIKCEKPAIKDDSRKQLIGITCWHNTPELYRRMVTHAAGLERSVVEKLDRDLTESEKVMLRSAISEMRQYLESLVRL